MGFTVLRRNLESSLRLLADVVRSPSYPNSEVEAEKRILIEAREKRDLGEIDFSSVALSVTFGEQHPLGAGPGTPESIRSVSAQDLRDFHDRFWRPDAAALLFAGDLTLKDAVRMATESFGGWSGKAAPQPKLPTPSPLPGRLFLVERKDRAQTTVAQILPGVPQSSPDYPALHVVVSVLGGMNDSRLRLNLRQEKGIAYSVQSTLATFPGVGLWEVYTQVQSDRAGLAFGEFRKELADIGGPRPITATEFESAKSGLIRGLPGRYASSWSAAQQVADNWSAGLPTNHDELFARRLSELTLAEVNAVARKYAQPGQAIFIFIGNREAVAPQVRDSGLGSLIPAR